METENYSSTFFTFIVRRGYLVIALARVILFAEELYTRISVNPYNDLLLTIILVLLLLLMSTTISKVSLEGTRLISKSDFLNRTIELKYVIEIIDIPLLLIPPIVIVRYTDQISKKRMIWFIATYGQSFRKHSKLEHLRRMSGLL